ncbi:carbohydrate kinase family protein [Herbiconiux ginsengi]|uniref:Sugar or nucleoside kinase, ribokinase family n=1 Tax=Herbiconiux ginsengi TaxID=381665 RepID=A0A1H3U6V2_9MICO|nr:carbohydrate kinase family protein [Herbiconiux ginsengi]SDZ57269.1 Sugar or nucleoside kinase, ribokinase family [Herbiconiux ginsengi]
MTAMVVAGHICLDLTPQLGASARLDPGRLIDVGPLGIGLGGCVANTGLALADLGADVSLHSTVGDDELGRILADTVARRPRLHSDLHVAPGRTTSYSLVLEPAGHDRTFWHHTGANAVFTGDTLDVGDAPLLHVGYPPLLPALLDDGGAPLERLLRRARERGATTSLDLAVVDPSSEVGSVDWTGVLRRAAAMTDILSPSLDDLTSALGATSGIPPLPAATAAQAYADLLLGWGAAVVAISAGSDGLLLRTASAERLQRGGRLLAPLASSWADTSLRVRPFLVERVVTTNGAGDASTAGLLFAVSRGASPTLAAHTAAAAAAAVISGRRPTAEVMSGILPAAANLFATVEG